eukprot:3934826-Rhodomonas_salina.1
MRGTERVYGAARHLSVFKRDDHQCALLVRQQQCAPPRIHIRYTTHGTEVAYAATRTLALRRGKGCWVQRSDAILF